MADVQVDLGARLDGVGSTVRLQREVYRLERALEQIGRFAASHSGRDAQDVLLAALYRVAEECERALDGGSVRA